MVKTARTFKIGDGPVEGRDVKLWQETLNDQLRRWGAEKLLEVDGEYGIATRSFTSKVLYGLGIPQSSMAHGVTPELRIKVRNRRLSAADCVRYVKRAAWRAKLRPRKVASPLAVIEADTWGWHPGQHDGLDLICPKDSTIFSMCDGVVVRADASGWWGKAPSGDVSLGDGIIIVRCTIKAGPFRRGLNICYGHAEHAKVKVGDVVQAGQPIGKAGLAVVPHIHFMVNALVPDPSSFVRGIGDRDPAPFYKYARKHG